MEQRVGTGWEREHLSSVTLSLLACHEKLRNNSYVEGLGERHPLLREWNSPVGNTFLDRVPQPTGSQQHLW